MPASARLGHLPGGADAREDARKVLRGEDADDLVADHRVRPDNEGLGHAVDPEIDGRPAFRVGADGGLSVRDLMKVDGWQTRTLPLDDGRIAVVDVARKDDLRIVELN